MPRFAEYKVSRGFELCPKRDETPILPLGYLAKNLYPIAPNVVDDKVPRACVPLYHRELDQKLGPVEPLRLLQKVGEARQQSRALNA